MLRYSLNLATILLVFIVFGTTALGGTVLFLGDIDGDDMGDGANLVNATADELMVAHIQALPQVETVIQRDDSEVTPDDLTGVDCVVISSTVFSGYILTSFGGDGSALFGSPLPIVSMEPGLADDMKLNNNAATQGQIPLSIIDIENPPLTGKPQGPLDVFVDDQEVIYHASLDEFPGIPPDIPPIPPSLPPGSVVGASFFSPFAIRLIPVLAVLEGRELADGSPAPGRRVGSFVGNGAFLGLTADGLMLFNRVFSLAHPLVGDMDWDGDVDFDDISPFVLGLNDPNRYESDFGVPPALSGDTDHDGDQDFDDIPAFVTILSSSGVSRTASVPEPSTLELGIAVLVAGGLSILFFSHRGTETQRRAQLTHSARFRSFLCVQGRGQHDGGNFT